MERSTSSGSSFAPVGAGTGGNSASLLGRDLSTLEGWGSIPGRFCLPERFVIFSNRADPPACIFASRRSRRRRVCFWLGVSASPPWDWGSGLSMIVREVNGKS